MKTLTISLIFLCSLYYAYAANNRKDSEARKASKVRSLNPEIMSERYDHETVALEFDKDCLSSKSSNVDKMSGLLLSQYPCLRLKFDRRKSFYNHGKIQRGYFKIDSDNSTCLNATKIDWNEFCIYHISYDLILNLYSSNINNVYCAADLINDIEYDNVKKAYAWHLDIIDGNQDYIYKKPDISIDGNDHGIDVWILDSGVYSEHSEFYSGQVIDEDTTFTTSGKHGTATASCVAGKNYGTARGFTIHDYPVCRISTGGCAFSDIDQGLNKVLNYMKTTGKRSVINMSLGSPGANIGTYLGQYYDGLFQDIIDAGGIVVASAGNDNTDACNYWFSYSDNVISVGSHDSSLKRSSFSNYGPCVDIYAPGSSVPLAASTTDPNYVNYMSGTSFSGPLIAGIVANMLYEDNTRTKEEIVQLLQSNSYAISDCSTGFCKGAYYQCQNVTDEPTTTLTTTTLETGCCASILNTPRFNRYCRGLSLNDCTAGRSIDYCFVDNTILKSQCSTINYN